VKYNKPDIVIVEVGITSFDNLRAVETEKKSKYDCTTVQHIVCNGMGRASYI
jgi:hypothetical protein